MNWKQLFENQYKLDAHIEDKHPRQEGEDRLKKKVVAFCTELGEMSNEWRGFKFWSDDQDPVTSKHELKKEYSHLHITQTGAYEYQLRDEYGTVVFDDVTDDHHDHKNPLLEEYIDIVHFAASIGLELKIDQYTVDPYKKGKKDVLSIIHDLYFTASLIGYQREKLKMYDVLLNLVTHLGIELGFTEEEIMDEYAKKNDKNFARQANGY